MQGCSEIQTLVFGRLGRLALALPGGVRCFPPLLIPSGSAWRRASIPGRWFRQALPSTPRTSWNQSSNLCAARSRLYFIHIYWNTTCYLDPVCVRRGAVRGRCRVKLAETKMADDRETALCGVIDLQSVLRQRS